MEESCIKAATLATELAKIKPEISHEVWDVFSQCSGLVQSFGLSNCQDRVKISKNDMINTRGSRNFLVKMSGGSKADLHVVIFENITKFIKKRTPGHWPGSAECAERLNNNSF